MEGLCQKKHLQKWQPQHRSHSLIAMKELSLLHHYKLPVPIRVKTISQESLCLPRDTWHRITRLALDKGAKCTWSSKWSVSLSTNEDIASNSLYITPRVLGNERLTLSPTTTCQCQRLFMIWRLLGTISSSLLALQYYVLFQASIPHLLRNSSGCFSWNVLFINLEGLGNFDILVVIEPK